MLINVSNLFKDHEPLPAFRFFVEVDGFAVGAFTQFSGVKMEVQTIQARSGEDIRGVQEFVPVLTRFAPVSLSRGVFGNDEFLRWITAASASRFLGPSGVSLRRTIRIIAPDDMRSRGLIWTLREAMPIGYELSPMDSMRSELLSESVTFAILGVERETSPLRFI